MIYTFVAGILVSLVFARYNKSNELFWKFVVSWILGFTTIVMCQRTFGERSSDDLTQVCPTQGVVVTPGNTVYLLADVAVTPTKVTASDPVSQVYTPEEREKNTIPSKVFGRTRDQPTTILTQPPECLTKVILTPHDTG